MPSRRDYQNNSLTDKVKAVAGTVKGKAQQAKETVSQTVRNRRARKELENYRDQEVTDQAEARRERIKQEAKQEAQQEARQEALEEYREELREEYREEARERYREEFGIAQTTEAGRQTRERGGMFSSLFTPADDPLGGRERVERQDERDMGPTLAPIVETGGPEQGGPYVPEMGRQDDRNAEDNAPQFGGFPSLGAPPAAEAEPTVQGPMGQVDDDYYEDLFRL